MATAKKAEVEVKSVEKVAPEKMEELAKKIWLAGLGAYGSTYEEAKSRVEKASAESKKLFEDLVVRGEKLQNEAESKIEEGKSELQTRIEDLKTKASQPFAKKASVTDALSEVNTKLDAISKDLKKKA